jgi:hypothetical protein
MNASGFAGWDAYPDAVVDIDYGDGAVTLGAEGVLSGNADDLDLPIFIVTAYNPGELASLLDNRAAQERLREFLSVRGVTAFAAVGRSRDDVWQEPSLALVGLSEVEAIDIGNAFGQDAIFGWDGRTLRVIPCQERHN